MFDEEGVLRNAKDERPRQKGETDGEAIITLLFTSKNAGVPSLFIKAVSDDGTNAEDFLSFLDNLNNSYGKLLKKLVENL